MQLYLQSGRAYMTLAPIVLRVGIHSFKTVVAMMQHDSARQALVGRRANRLGADGNFQEVGYEDISAGDIVRVDQDDFSPADILLLFAEENGRASELMNVDSSNIDGESEAHIRQVGHKLYRP